MSLQFGGSIVTQGLILNYDPANIFSYIGSGNTIINIFGDNFPSTLSSVVFSNNNSGVLSFDGNASCVLSQNQFIGVGTTANFTINAWVNLASISTSCIFNHWFN